MNPAHGAFRSRRRGHSLPPFEARLFDRWNDKDRQAVPREEQGQALKNGVCLETQNEGVGFLLHAAGGCDELQIG